MDQDNIDISKYANFNQDVIIEVNNSLKGIELEKSLFNKNIDINIEKIRRFIDTMLNKNGSIDLIYIKDDDYFSFLKSYCKDKKIYYLILNDKILINKKIHSEKEKILAKEMNEKQKLKEKQKKINKAEEILDEVGIFEDFENKKTYEQLVNQIINSNFDTDSVKLLIQNYFDKITIEAEKERIAERERRFELKKRAEREYYGKEKTKRVMLSDEDKENILANFNHQCTICSAKEGLHIHHKDKNPSNNQMSNLLVLCGVCHKKVHMNVR
ncbi:MAG: hypothetical protein WC916_02955 [Candidatus Woesearchaeota archaeon]